MAKSRRKAGGCKNGTFKRKKMGKGWSTVREQPQDPRQVVRLTPAKDSESDEGTQSGD